MPTVPSIAIICYWINLLLVDDVSQRTSLLLHHSKGSGKVAHCTYVNFPVPQFGHGNFGAFFGPERHPRRVLCHEFQVPHEAGTCVPRSINVLWHFSKNTCTRSLKHSITVYDKLSTKKKGMMSILKKPKFKAYINMFPKRVPRQNCNPHSISFFCHIFEIWYIMY